MFDQQGDHVVATRSVSVADGVELQRIELLVLADEVSGIASESIQKPRERFGIQRGLQVFAAVEVDTAFAQQIRYAT